MHRQGRKTFFIRQHIFLMLIMLFWSCHHRYLPQLVECDNLLSTKPDSALCLLDSMANEIINSSKANRMYWKLLQADAQNKCYVNFSTDSTMLQLVEYYDAYGTTNERIRAHYLLGCVYRDLGDAPQALQCYQDAIDAADTLKSDCAYALLSRIYGQSGNLFRNESLYRNAIENYSSASKYAWRAKDTLAALLAYGQTAACYYGLGDEDSTITVSLLTRKRLLEYADTSIANTFLAAPIYILLQRQQYEEAKTFIDLYQYHSSLTQNDTFLSPRYYKLYYYKGLYYQGVGQRDSALFFFHKLSMTGKTLDNIELGYKGLFNLYSDVNVQDSMVKYARLYTLYNDSIVSSVEQSKLQSVQGLYNYTYHQRLAEMQRQKANRLRFWLYLALLLSVIIIFSTILIVRVVRAKGRQRLLCLSSKYVLGMIEFQRLKTEKDNLEQQHDRIKEKYETVVKDYEHVRNLLADMQGDKKSPEEWDLGDALLQLPIVLKFHKIAATASVVSDDDWSQLRTTAKLYLPNFLETINGLSYKINRRETDICILLRLRFIPSEICNIIPIKKNNLGNLRKRLLKSMFEIEGSSKDFDSYIQQIPR